MLRGDEMQLSRGESVADTARVLSRFVHAIVIRSGSHEERRRARRVADVPVDQRAHPAPPPLPGARRPADPARALRRRSRACGSPTSATATTSPARSRCSARTAGVEVVVSSPAGYELERAGGAELIADPREAVAGADAIYTDVWVSMGDEDDGRRNAARRSRPTGSTTSCSRPPPIERSSCTACPPTPARRSAPTSSTASARRSGTRPRTACTPRRRCSSCCWRRRRSRRPAPARPRRRSG